MAHAATYCKMYIDETEILIFIKKQTCFEDKFTHYTKRSIDYEEIIH